MNCEETQIVTRGESADGGNMRGPGTELLHKLLRGQMPPFSVRRVGHLGKSAVKLFLCATT
jgi:hypothetical protein